MMSMLPKSVLPPKIFDLAGVAHQALALVIAMQTDIGAIRTAAERLVELEESREAAQRC
jgi:hypothetical protein